MKEITTYHAVHDQNGNIKSIFATTSSVGAQLMMTAGRGCFISQVNLPKFNPAKSKLPAEEDANRLRELRKHYRVDTSARASLIKKAPANAGRD